MLAEITEEKNESLILELSDDQHVGIVGGYCEENFPLYYVNEQFAHMLGYDNVDDFIKGIDGKVSNTIHPDDMKQVVKDLNNGNFYEGMTYKTTYRMPKKEGGWFWTVDKGKVIQAEDGRLAILSICSDMSDFLDRQSELERQNYLSRITIDSMPGGYHQCAAEEGFPFLYVSDRFLDIFGWSREEIKTEFDNKFINMLHPDDRILTTSFVERIIENCGTNRISDAIYRMRGRDGYIWVSDATSLVKVGDGIFYQGTLTDISSFVLGKESREKELKNSYRQLEEMHNIISASNMGTWKIELIDGRAPRMLADEQMLHLLGIHGRYLSPEEVYTAWFSNITPDAVESVLLSVESMKTGHKNENTYLWQHPFLGERYVRCGGTAKIVPGGYILSGYHYDVDDIVREQLRQHELLEESLAAEKKHLKVIASLSTIYTTIINIDLNTHDYEILNSVELMHKVAGTSGNFDVVKDKALEAFMESDIRDEMRQFMDLDTMAERFENSNTIATEYRNPEGRWFQARFIVKTRDAAGRAQEVLYVARDFTEEKQHELEQEAALRDALIVAKHANRAKTTFLNNMSHDIRTPMNAIIGFTALAQTHINDTERVQDYLGKIHTSGTHLLSLINEILDMSRIESGTVKLEENVVHIPDVLHDLRTIIQGQVAAKQQNLYIDTLDVAHEDVVTDKLRLNQILLNIVGNAIKYTGIGGNIIVRVTEKPCKLSGYTTYEFSIRDTGMGMAPDFVGHVFDTFSRERSTTISGIQGTGLGMSITKNIVDMMNGAITVESELGKGTEFVVTIDFRLAEEKIEYKPIPELQGARALVVDDDINTCQSVSKMLREIDMRPDWSTSGKEAVVRAKEASDIKEEYKVYIIDYLMPDMNGIEAVRQIRKVIGDEIPIIVLTAYEWTDFEAEAREAGVTAFVAKPIFMSELRAVLTNKDNGRDTAETEQNIVRNYHGRRVLLVEDNELNRELASNLLGDMGLIVDTAVDGIDALSIITKAPDDLYDLVLMDIQMPKMDGYTVTREIRTLANNRKANIPIVAMTANAFEEDRQKSFLAGMNGHIAKPIDLEAVAKALDRVFNIS